MVTELLSYKILRTDLREYIIKRVKDPLRKAIILAAKLIPEITRENTRYRNTHTLIGITGDFYQHEKNPQRLNLFQAAFKIFLFEIEHDTYYRDRFNWFLEEIIKAILRGDWEERTNGHPYKPNWVEESNYGGKYSIMRKLTTLEGVNNGSNN